MTSPWNLEQVRQMAPDGASLSAGQSLARPAKWLELGRSDRAFWGKLQGSGKDPYMTRVDLSGPRYKCSCPSRKFPCKHGIGLLLIAAQSFDAIPPTDEPDWVKPWLDDGQARRENPAPKTEKPVDAQAQAKRREARQARVEAGLDELELYLADVLRQGITSAGVTDPDPWENLRARMVDAQAPGLANQVQRISSTFNKGPTWQRDCALEIGRAAALIHAARNIDKLPEPLSHDIRALLGWAVDQAQVESTPPVTDTWRVLSRTIEPAERLSVERVWLHGESTRRFGLSLSFIAAAGPARLSGLTCGTQFHGPVRFYPGTQPNRVLIPQDRKHVPIQNPPDGFDSLGSLLDQHARALAENPFLTRWPAFLAGVWLTPRHEPAADSADDNADATWHVVDRDGRSLPAAGSPGWLWPMTALCAGRPMTLLVELDADRLTVLGAWAGQESLWAWSDGRQATSIRGARP